jgi:hypothetical protein
VATAAEEERARRPGQERQQDRGRDTDDGAQHTAPRSSKGKEGTVAEAKRGCVIGTQFEGSESNCHKPAGTNKLASDTSCSVFFFLTTHIVLG